MLINMVNDKNIVYVLLTAFPIVNLTVSFKLSPNSNPKLRTYPFLVLTIVLNIIFTSTQILNSSKHYSNNIPNPYP